MRSRLALVLVLVAALAGAGYVERERAPSAAEGPTAGFGRVAPLVASDDVLGSTWYCAAGSSDADGPADHTVVVSNPGGVDREATVTVVPGTADPVTTVVDVPAASIERVHLADLVEAPAAAAMVEVDGGGVAVTHELVGPTGADRGPCASTSSDTWHFAWGDTSRDARSLVALFNPFPGDAVVDFEFVTVDGSRAPQALTGVVVPGRSVVVADVGEEVARRDQVSTTVTARTGRIVAERIQTFDDTEEMLEGAEPRRALTVDLGVTQLMDIWVHPGARLAEGSTERVVVYNPGSSTAEIDVEVLVADPEWGGIEPFELTVGPQRYEVLDLSDQSRLAERFEDGPIEATVVVRSLNGVPVVAERVTVVPTSANGPGVSASTGSPLIGRTQLVVDPRPQGADDSVVALVNPHAEGIVTGTIRVLARGSDRELDGYEDFEIPAGGRLLLDDLSDGVTAAGSSMLVIESSRPLAVGTRARSGDPVDRFSVAAFVYSDVAELPPDILATG